MALGAFVAGRYSSTYTAPAGSAVDMGITDQGWEIEAAAASQLIGETDSDGEGVIDGIYRGLSNVFIQGNGLEWTAGMLRACFPYGAAVPASGVGYIGPGVVGRLNSAVAGIIVLSATSGTPAAAAPASITATYCIVAEGFPVKMLFNSKLRTLPGRWRVLAYDASGTRKHMTFT